MMTVKSISLEDARQCTSLITSMVLSTLQRVGEVFSKQHLVTAVFNWLSIDCWPITELSIAKPKQTQFPFDAQLKTTLLWYICWELGVKYENMNDTHHKIVAYELRHKTGKILCVDTSVHIRYPNHTINLFCFRHDLKNIIGRISDYVCIKCQLGAR